MNQLSLSLQQVELEELDNKSRNKINNLGTIYVLNKYLLDTFIHKNIADNYICIYHLNTLA